MGGGHMQLLKNQCPLHSSRHGPGNTDFSYFVKQNKQKIQYFNETYCRHARAEIGSPGGFRF